jgi:uncharacterized protein YdhG (YjbR/CyaY superfamily)
MVQSAAATVDQWMAEVEDARRPALERFRALCREVLVGREEKMAYGMPAYARGELMTAFNNQKGYIAFYAGQTAIQNHRAALAGVDCGKGCIRYKKIDRIDFDVVRSILEDINSRDA